MNIASLEIDVTFFGEGLGQGRLAHKRIATKRSSACPYKWGEVEGEEEM